MRDVLPYALGVAISPVAIVSMLVLITSRRAGTTGSSFACGWSASVAVLAGVLAVVVREAGAVDEHPTWIGALELALGCAFLAAAVTLLRRRGRRRARSTSVVASADMLTPLRAAGLGVVLSAANPKVLGLALGAAVTLAEANASAAATAGAVGLFALVGAAGVVVPLAAYLAFPLRSRSALAGTRAALIRHETAVLVLLGFAIGAIFLVDGLRSIR